MPARLNLAYGRTLLQEGVAYARGDGRGLAGALALHGMFALLVLLFMLHRAVPPIPPSHIVPIDLVHIGEETVSPPAPIKAKIPHDFAPPTPQRQAASAN